MPHHRDVLRIELVQAAQAQEVNDQLEQIVGKTAVSPE